jgi:hypothetical protein
MATLDELVDLGVLRRQRIDLGRKDFPDRKLYVTPEFREWLNKVVMQADPFYKTNARPRYQAHDLIKAFITGRPFLENRLFKRMSPNSDDVYELRTPDLRFFGWFPHKDCFVAVVGDTFERLKEEPSLYEKHRIHCVAFRREIDLDEPKYEAGAGEHGVISC